MKKNNEIEMSFLAQPTDVNYFGSVHGGNVMKWIDEAAYALAVQHTHKYCVTKYVDGIEFTNPISIGDLVHLHARVLQKGTTSIRMHVTVCSENLVSNRRLENCACDIVFVAVDKQGNKQKIQD